MSAPTEGVQYEVYVDGVRQLAYSLAEHERLVAEAVAAERERCAAIARDEMLRKSSLSVFASLGEVLRCIEADR